MKTTLIALHDRIFTPLERADWLLPTLARLVFAGVLLGYFWASLAELGLFRASRAELGCF